MKHLMIKKKKFINLINQIYIKIKSQNSKSNDYIGDDVKTHLKAIKDHFEN